ncbi:MAG: hypothetical protein P8N51_19125 [Pseudomonadales bacterium]|nr:hypothetical protein [Pseudomonadales bacterium]MDG1441408.1 hypothetical protein [Pseudomonadales bacterium]
MLIQKVTILVITVFLLTTNQLATADTRHDTQYDPEIAASVASAMVALDEFMLHFNAKKPTAWAATLNYPHVRFASGGVTVYENQTIFSDTKAFEQLAKIGWDHSHWLERNVTLASKNKVHISTVFQRFNSRNQPIGTYQSLYIVTNVDGHWGTQARSSLAP